jgi:large subunit ribosomal protein L6
MLGSHIGSAPVTYPASCKLTSDLVREELAIEGPLGVERVTIKPFVRLFHTGPAAADGEGVIEVAVDDQTIKTQRQMWGTTRQLLANAVRGVTEGFRLPVKLIGVGYRAAVEDAPVPPGTDAKLWVNKKRLNLKLGFSHPILLTIPDHVTVEVPIPTKFFISGTSLQTISQFAADVRSHRPPEPYRGKVRRGRGSLTVLRLLVFMG